MNILIVDDSADSRRLLEKLLKLDLGVSQVHAAASATEALEWLGIAGAKKHSPEDLDLILMDITMPEIDGVEACRRIKSRSEFQDIPVIMVSSNEGGHFLDDAFTAGAADYITKPLNRRELRARVSSALALKRETDDRKRAYVELEKQFLQSQKLESVGRLAGGIAHDFNNMLTPIMGYAQLGLSQVPPEDSLHTNLQEVMKAAEKAAKLARQLLGFSRRHLVEPKIVNLNDLVEDIHNMLRRLIGDDVELVGVDSPNLAAVKVDPGQIEQVLMNLVVNSRDAIPDGGSITIETQNYMHGKSAPLDTPVMPAGPYVVLAVRDTGTGMSEEIKAHIFEPFFTTKEDGKGTGLGLATCRSIVEQNGGYMSVESEIGEGTTIRVYLSAVGYLPSAAKPALETIALPSGTETILLAEDEPLVRNMISILLSDRGYTVLESSDGEDALKVAALHSDQEIDLLLTDMVMPKMGGVELASRFVEMRPDARVLFTSGHVEEYLISQGLPGLSSKFIQKPFPQATLACTVRELLDSRACAKT